MNVLLVLEDDRGVTNPCQFEKKKKCIQFSLTWWCTPYLRVGINEWNKDRAWA